jgi:hypothetical protein
MCRPAGNLLGRPALGQSAPNVVVELPIIQLPRTNPSSRPGLVLGVAGAGRHAIAVVGQLAADRAPVPTETSGHLGLGQPVRPKLRYPFTLRKYDLTCHRWDSVPTPIPKHRH